MATSKLLETLSSVTPEDIEEIDADIAELNKRLLRLRSLRRLVAAAVDGPGKSAKEASAAGTDAKRLHLAKLLMHGGPTSLESLCRALDVEDGRSLSVALRHDWFEKRPDGKYQLAVTGRTEYAKRASAG